MAPEFFMEPLCRICVPVRGTSPFPAAVTDSYGSIFSGIPDFRNCVFLQYRQKSLEPVIGDS